MKPLIMIALVVVGLAMWMHRRRQLSAHVDVIAGDAGHSAGDGGGDGGGGGD